MVDAVDKTTNDAHTAQRFTDADALRFAANEKTSSPPSVDDGAESNAERVKQEKKAEETDIGNVIRESLDKIDAQIRKVLDESQMKVEA